MRGDRCLAVAVAVAVALVASALLAASGAGAARLRQADGGGLLAGTWANGDRVEGVAFLYEAPSAGAIVTIAGPDGYRTGIGYAQDNFPGMAPNLFVRWDALDHPGGSYTATPWPAGPATTLAVDGATAMTGVQIARTSLAATAGTASWAWHAPPEARSFLALVQLQSQERVRPEVVAKVLPANARSVEFDGLSLDASTRYSAVLEAFSADLTSSAPPSGPFEIEGDSVDFQPARALATSFHYVRGESCTNVTFPQPDWFGPGIGEANATTPGSASAIVAAGGTFSVGRIASGASDVVRATSPQAAQMHVGGLSTDGTDRYVAVETYTLQAGACPQPQPQPAPAPAPAAPAPTHAERESIHHPARTFASYHNASGLGRSISAGQTVQVSCKVHDGTIKSVNPDGYWYRIASPPWNDRFYAAANTFLNGDRPNGPYSHATDFAVPDCGANRGVPAPSATGRPAAPQPGASPPSLAPLAGSIVQWAGDEKAQKTSWLVGRDLKRRWIPDVATYDCLLENGVELASSPLDSSILDRLADLTGVSASCPHVTPCVLPMRWDKLSLTFSYSGSHRYYGNARQAAANWTDLHTGITVMPAPAGTKADIVFDDVYLPKARWYGQTELPAAWATPSTKVRLAPYVPRTIHIELNQAAVEASHGALDDFHRTLAATHELGHALGLAHPDACGITSPSIMRAGGDDVPTRSFNRPQSFDKLALEELYNLPTGFALP